MTPTEAMALADKWTHDMKADQDYQHIPLFDAMRTLLDHCRVQDKDIKELTSACQILFRENNRLRNKVNQ